MFFNGNTIISVYPELIINWKYCIKITPNVGNPIKAANKWIIQYASFILRQWFLPFFYVKSGSNLKPNGSFEICSSWGFQNTPYMLNLMEFWLSYMRLKTSDTTSKSNFDSTLLLLWKLSLAFNHEYLSQFLIKFKDQGQFWNLLFTRIPKVSLIFKIDKELTEIFKVKGKAQFLKKQ